MRLLAMLSVMALASGPALAQHLKPVDLASQPVVKPTVVAAYGADPLQFGELRLPKGKGPFPVAIVIHGGCWSKGFATLAYMSPLAARLADLGVATWNVEYRQLGDAGAGWPGTFLDWASAADHLRVLASRYPLDLGRVIAIGHSAGAHGALWLSSRRDLPLTSSVRGVEPLPLVAAVAVDGPGDIAAFIGKDAAICGRPVIAPFMGGAPAADPDAYTQGNPVALTSDARQILVASQVLTTAEADDYQRTAKARTRPQVLTVQDAGHFDMLAPGRPAEAVLEAAILEALSK